jgi:hypothetical protein
LQDCIELRGKAHLEETISLVANHVLHTLRREPSVVISSTQQHSTALNGPQWHSMALSGTQRHLQRELRVDEDVLQTARSAHEHVGVARERLELFLDRVSAHNQSEAHRRLYEV